MGRPRASNDPSVRIELTERQKEVLRLIASGRTNGQIADELGLSLDGVKWHVREILTRLGVDSREEAAAWWRQNRGVRDRMPGWLGWPLAAGFGGLTATALAVTFAASFMFNTTDEPPPDEPEFLEQPELTLAGEGDGWRVYVDDEGGVPHAGEAVLAIRESGASTEVLVIESTTGRIAARWETGYNATATLRQSANELLVSDSISASEQENAWRLMRFSLDSFELLDERPLPGRIQTRWPVGGLLRLNEDRDVLFYAANAYPDCFEQIGEHARVARDCDRSRVGIVDLSVPGETPRLADAGESCFPHSAFHREVPGQANMHLACKGGEVFSVNVDGTVERRDQQFPERRDAAGELGNALRPVGVVVGDGWIGGMYGDGMFVWVHDDGTVERVSSVLGPMTPRDTLSVSPSRVIITYEPSPRPEDSGFVIFDAERGEVNAQHDIGAFTSFLVVSSTNALVLARDGTVMQLDIDTGGTERLPYRLPTHTAVTLTR